MSNITFKGFSIFAYSLVMTGLTAANFNQVKNFPQIASFNTIIMIMSLVIAVISLTYWAMSAFSPCPISFPKNVAKNDLNSLQNMLLFFMFVGVLVLSVLSKTSSDFGNLPQSGQTLIWSEMGVTIGAIVLLGLSAL